MLLMPNLTLAIIQGLASGGVVGPAVPQLAQGIAGGIMRWVPLLIVSTVDTGTYGVGSGMAPFALDVGSLTTNLMNAYAVNGQLGPMSKPEAKGLASGLASGFAQGIMKTSHATTGSGDALARVFGPLAFSSLEQGFKAAGMKGPSSVKKCKAISTALFLGLQLFQMPIKILGPSSPSPGGGSGIGRVY
jgi:hypothetical protein